MQSPQSRLSRRIGMAVCLGALALIVFGMVMRESSAGDRMYLLIRWPLWVLGLSVPPLLAVRTTLRWRKRRAAALAVDGELKS